MNLLVTKHSRTLIVYDQGMEVRRISVVIGKNPADKQREGDLATPEGEFYICYKNPNSKYHRFLGLSYPNSEDAERGLREGLIGREQYQAIYEAISKRECPPWKTALGGEIGLHGPSPNITWTHGCIAMTVDEIEWLYDHLTLGDSVNIVA